MILVERFWLRNLCALRTQCHLVVDYELCVSSSWIKFLDKENGNGGSDSKASDYNEGDPGSIPGSGRFPWRRKWQPTPVLLLGKSHGQRSLELFVWTEATVHGVTKSWTQLSDFTFTVSCSPSCCEWLCHQSTLLSTLLMSMWAAIQCWHFQMSQGFSWPPLTLCIHKMQLCEYLWWSHTLLIKSLLPLCLVHDMAATSSDQPLVWFFFFSCSPTQLSCGRRRWVGGKPPAP